MPLLRNERPATSGLKGPLSAVPAPFNADPAQDPAQDPVVGAAPCKDGFLKGIQGEETPEGLRPPPWGIVGVLFCDISNGAGS